MACLAPQVFVAVGRPGEPLGSSGTSAAGAPPRSDGVSVQRYTTADFVTYSEPMTVLFLANGPAAGGQLGDGSIWTIKSMDRNDDGCASTVRLL